MWDDIKAYAGAVWGNGTAFFTSTAAKAIQPLIDLVNWLVGKVDYWVNILVGQTADLYARLSSIGGSVLSGAISSLTAAFTYADTIFNKAVGYAQSLYNQAVGLAQGLYNQAIGYANAVLGELRSFEQSVQGWVIANIWNPLYNLAATALNEVRALTGQITSWVIDNVYNPIMALIHDAISAAVDAWNWITSTGAWLFGIVKAAEHWLIWAATVDFNAAVAMWQWLTHPNARAIINSTESVAETLGADLEDIIVNWLRQ